uniref:EGF domain-specific O-linked N-acetylglucosamine transferase n=1 Tax=Phallusia mammillata TaxID=59560 RepID=A0A6F9DBC1_9ASCI|nr:glycosyltransferase [Phallusia mammillata]
MLFLAVGCNIQMLLCCVFLALSVAVATGDVDLPLRHRNILYHRKPWLCRQKGNCDIEESPKCWGHEDDCVNRFEPDWPDSCDERKQWRFWQQGDFGWMRTRLDELRGMRVCESESGSSLNCTKWLQFCQGSFIYLDLRGDKPRGFHPTNLFSNGEIGGKCHVDVELLKGQSLPKVEGWLRSWYPELQAFENVPYAHNDSFCDMIINEPVVMMKLDQGENLYHHMCDFLNLYLSLHLNDSIEFDKNIRIVRWDWSVRPYKDFFHESWEAFTKHPLVNLRDWAGKRVCLKSVIFSFLPRMISGLYYNLKLVDECQGSGMVKSFSQFFLHRLRIQQYPPQKEKIRVTFLSRRSYDSHITHPMYRKILNEDELLEVLRSFPDFQLRVEEFKHDDMTFKDQLSVTSNTDILIGIHGAGLTHALFLPNHAVIFELYDCDAKCFRDLARLRGVRHMTWQNPETMTRHDGDEKYKDNPRYWNYSFQPDDFRRLILQARTMLFERWSAAAVHNEL